MSEELKPALYTMDQMRGYAQAFHDSRTSPAESDELEALRKDADRWRACVEFGLFPEYGTGDKGTWVWYVSDHGREDESPEECADWIIEELARRIAAKKEKAG